MSARFGVVVFPGSNCDRDCLHVLHEVLGCPAEFVWHESEDLSGFDVVVLPGGFSYGDYLRPGAVAATSPVVRAVKHFAAAGGLVLGICNGFQVLTEAGLLPGALLRNRGATFRCEWVSLRVERSDTPFTALYEPGEVVRMPIAHGDGRYHAPEEVAEELERCRQVVFRYVDNRGRTTAEGNPNGSVHHIAGVVNRAGNVLGLMPHPERCAEEVLGGTDGRRLFESVHRWAAHAAGRVP
ncbi:MAG: phosphoribosylformylglycinamidine synthase I [candidate division GAL15 bacterium]